jgi:histone H4
MAPKGKTSKSKPSASTKRAAGGKKAAAPTGRGITKGSIRKLARRGGCKRLASNVYDEARTILKSFVDNVMADTSALIQMTGRKTVRAADILFALKKQGRTLYAVA